MEKIGVSQQGQDRSGFLGDAAQGTNQRPSMNHGLEPFGLIARERRGVALVNGERNSPFSTAGE
ncbi:MAG: hypothetical protein O6768_06380, partial [Planctomycetota bacterium]|nr:hypothetical protein [Planctomycetota bacterium]